MIGNYRNSRTDKLQITWIPIYFRGRNNQGQIGVTLCPGKYQPHSMSGGWNRDLELDVRELKYAKVGHVISLITHQEMRQLKVTNLARKLDKYDISWHHLPTPDARVPDPRWTLKAIKVIVEIMANFHTGERVVVHCKGGISRAGMFACLTQWLLSDIEMSDAIGLVRDRRDKRGINIEQESYLMEFSETYQTWMQGTCRLDQWQEDMV